MIEWLEMSRKHIYSLVICAGIEMIWIEKLREYARSFLCRGNLSVAKG
jgi:hypothetical protein